MGLISQRYHLDLVYTAYTFDICRKYEWYMPQIPNTIDRIIFTHYNLWH